MATINIDRLEHKRQLLQSSLDSAKTAAERNRLGQFATPNLLAIEITRYIATMIDDDEINFADPSIGTGSFFSAALTILGRARIKSAIGVELDSDFSSSANNLWREVGLQVITGDFTELVEKSSSLTSPNLLLANPPYVRHHHLSRDDKKRLQRLVQRLVGVDVNGLAGLYVYFLLLATYWMADNGYAAWLIPSEFMDVNYGASLKQFLTSQVTLIRVHRFSPDDIQFGDALVSSAVLIFRKTQPPVNHAAEFTFGGTLSDPETKEQVALNRLQESRKWTAYPNLPQDERSNISEGTGITLANYFRIQRGIATGDNKFFIIEQDEAIRRGFPRNCIRPILPSPRHLKETVIKPDCDGFPLTNPRLCVIDCDLPEHVVEKRYPKLWEYLVSADSLGVKDGYLVSKRNPWYQQEKREPPMFLCTYMGRGTQERKPFRFIWNQTNAIATNLYLMLYPVKSLQRMLVNHPERAEEVYKILCLVTGNELRGEGRVYGGGLHKIEPKELGRISALPFVEQWPELQMDGIKQKMLFE